MMMEEEEKQLGFCHFNFEVPFGDPDGILEVGLETVFSHLGDS